MPPAAHPIVEGLLELAYPTRCVVCEASGSLLCEDDRRQLAYIDHALACPRCSAPYGLYLCTECMTREGPERFAFTAAVSALLYDRRAEALITAYKDENERRLAHELACLLAASLPDEWRQWADALTWVPADAQARRRRGFDHMQMVAVELGDMSGIACMGLLSKQPLADQRSLSRRQRRANVSGLFSLDMTPPGNLATEALPQRILIIDDVFTTGATLDAAVSALIGAGVSEVRAVTVARVW